MSRWKGLRARLRAWLRPRRADQELEEELRFHIEMETSRQLRDGLSGAEARRRALLTFGSVDRTVEEHRDVRGVPFLERRWRDLRYAARGLRADAGFTLAAVLTLVLGIGANTAAFGVVDALLYRPPAAVGEPDGLYRVRLLTPWEEDGRRWQQPVWWSYPLYEDLRDGSGAFASLAAYRLRPVIVGRGESARELPALEVTRNYAEVMRVRAELGRWFVPGDERAAGAEVVIGYDLWQRQFGGSRDVLGRTLELSGVPFEIIGVAPRHFRGIDLDPVDLWLPVGAELRFGSTDVLDARNTFWLWLAGRPVDGMTPEVAASRVSATVAAGVRENPDAPAMSSLADLIPVTARFASDSDPSPVPVWLLGITAIVLLIACANVANLLFARGAARCREFAIRAAVGASRGGIVAQLLTESLLLALLGAAGGLGLALAAGRLLPLLDVPALEPLIDVRVLAFSVAVAVLTSVFVGLMPAVRASRTDVESELKSATPRVTYDRSRVRGALTVLQVALSIILLVNAGLFIRSLRNVESIESQFEYDRLLVVTMRYPRGEATDRLLRIKREALERISALPAVESAALTRAAPFYAGLGRVRLDPAIAGQPADALVTSYTLDVGPGYFETIGMPLLAGRAIEASDRADTRPVIVVNAAFARMLGGGIADAVGRCLPLRRDGCIEIVGVVGDSRFLDPIERAEPAMYHPFEQGEPGWIARGLLLLVRARDATSALAGTIRRELVALDPALQYVEVMPMSELLRPRFQPWRVAMVIFTLFGAVAFLLAAVGLYGVVAYLVAARRAELGIRIALGAGRARILRLVLGEGARLAAAGAALGLFGAFWVSRLLENRMYGVRPTDPPTWLAVTLLVAAVAFGASWVSAERAARVNPNLALRSE